MITVTFSGEKPQWLNKLNKRLVLNVAIALVGLLLSADSCSSSAPANTVEQSSQQNQQDIYNTVQPLPNFPYSEYRQTLIQIETQLATGTIKTYAVQESYGGTPELVFPTLGWPIPVTTQLSNPFQASRDGSYTGGAPVALGQMDPIGIYPAPSGLGTWLLILDARGRPHPAYIEGVVDAYTFPVAIENGHIVQIGQPGDDSVIKPCNYSATLKKCI